MNDDIFNMNIRKFLKMVGVKSQHEIEQAVAQAVANGQVKGDETLSARMTLTIGQVNLNASFDGMIDLEQASRVWIGLRLPKSLSRFCSKYLLSKGLQLEVNQIVTGKNHHASSPCRQRRLI